MLLNSLHPFASEAAKCQDRPAFEGSMTVLGTSATYRSGHTMSGSEDLADENRGHFWFKSVS
jgi:hypothetical protein